MPFYKNGTYIQDPNNDTNGSRNVVSDPDNDVAFYYNDGVYLYFRLRLDQSPAGTGGQGLLGPFGWGMVIDTDLNANNYELLVILDGVSKVEGIAIWQNTVQGTLGSPTDPPEVMYSSAPLPGNYAIVQANTSINGDPDYFLDFRCSYAQLKAAGGLTDYTRLRFFFATSSNGSSFSGGGGDLVGATDLYTGLSDQVALTGTDGTVRFAADLAGAGDTVSLIAGGTAYLRVDDADANSRAAAADLVSVTVSAPSGDTLPVTLAETGVNTGVFTGQVVTFSSAPVSGSGSLEVMPGETVTALYSDAFTAALLLNQPRTDTLLIPGPVLAVTKTADSPALLSGATVTYTLTLTNSGDGEAWVTQIQDILPAGFTYSTGSAAGLTYSTPSISGHILSWTGYWKVPRKISGVNGTAQMTFSAVVLGPAGTYYNNAAASGPNFALASSGDTAPVSITSPLLSITKAASAASALPGAQITYTALYSNLGDGEATNVTIVDAVPPETLYLPGSLRKGAAGDTYAVAPSSFTDAADSDQGSYSAGEVTFTLPSVPAGGTGTLFFKVTVK
ncbi:MAG: hypothetical protein A3K53_09515 [Deltaproteobacteria bacterium RIFOXYB2_FULL_66_7]|nr:MAG: hypothetical protein A3K53_09515 [Deltaproteobacteria bacterium RIFOXYB2_FULL_66_7]